MADLIRVKTFNPTVLSVAEVRGKILSTIQGEARYIESLFELTYATWDDPPRATNTFTFAGGDATLLVGLTGSEAGILHWEMLNEGFERQTRLSSDWISKTRPGQLKAGPGRGQAVGQLKAAKRVESRRWMPIIKRRVRGRFVKAVKRAIREGIDLARSRGKPVPNN